MDIKLSSFSASFHDYITDLDYYHGKDVIHQGNLLKLDPEYSWEKINSKIRNKIRKAQKLDVKIERVKGTEEDIANFRTVWFDANDDTLPNHLEDDEIMYMAYMDGKLAGGLILSPVGKNLYMHNLGANEEGKRNSIPALLLWNAVEDLKDSQYNYIDVGVSFRPTLYSFFKNWQTESYPIIFTAPFIRPDLRLTPFGNTDIAQYTGDATAQEQAVVEQYFGENHTILPRAIYCIKAVMQHLGLTSQDNVAVFKTFDNDYISRCVTAPIEKYCSVSREITDQTKAVLVIHEFGHPFKETLKLKKECEKRNIPLIEDCAWSYGTALDDTHKIGDVGDYAIFSLPKFLPLQYGAVLKGLTISDEDNWNNYRLLDYFKRQLVVRELARLLPTLEAANQQRRENWTYLASLFAKDGLEPFSPLEDNVYPGAFIVKVDDYQQIFDTYTEFGVESGRYYPEEALFLPIHQNLTPSQLDYIYAAFRGKLNLCSGYRRDGK